MPKRIIYKNVNGGVSIVVPMQQFIDSIGVEGIALLEVPAGFPYKIVDTEIIPADRTFRNAWEVDELILTDGVGADYGVGSLWQVSLWIDDKPIEITNSETGETRQLNSQ